MRWFAAVAGEWLLIAGCLACASLWPVLLPLAVVVGIRQHALGVLGHDAAHRHAGSLGVALAGPLCFWPLGVGLAGYKAFHWQHHRGVGEPADPEMPVRRRQEVRNARIGIWRAATLDLVGCGLNDLRMIVRDVRRVALADYAGPLAVHALFVWLAPWPAIVAWYVGMGTGFMAAFRLRAATEHLGRITFTLARPAMWRRALYLPHHTWRHYEHHQRPGIPTWRL